MLFWWDSVASRPTIRNTRKKGSQRRR